MESPLQLDDFLRLLPAEWQTLLAGHAVEPAPGLGGASVFKVSGARGVRYLKLACGPDAPLLAQEIARTAWLAARRIRVPEFIKTACGGEVAAGLMTAVPGRHPSPDCGDPSAVARAIGRGLARLHALPAAGCPFDEMPRTRLRRAREAIERNLIDPAAFDDRNAGVTPEALYRRLAGAVPAEEGIVVAHGDATLENMLIGDDGELGFIDCGHAGRSDRYVDLAVVEADLRAAFGQDAVGDFLAAYGARHWNERKAAFFLDLYELF